MQVEAEAEKSRTGYVAKRREYAAVKKGGSALDGIAARVTQGPLMLLKAAYQVGNCLHSEESGKC